MEFAKKYSRQITAGIQLALCAMMAIVALQRELRLGHKVSKKVRQNQAVKRAKRS